MWRKALIGPALTGSAVALVLLLPGCADFGDFVGDTFTYGTNPNLPAGSSENMKRVMGNDTPVGVLQTEPGNVWPNGVEAVPTLQQLEQESNSGGSPAAPAPDMSRYMPDTGKTRGHGTGTGNATPGGAGSGSATAPAAPSSGGGGNGKSGEIVIPNGNGTSTIIKPDGTVVTVPTPK